MEPCPCVDNCPCPMAPFCPCQFVSTVLNTVDQLGTYELVGLGALAVVLLFVSFKLVGAVCSLFSSKPVAHHEETDKDQLSQVIDKLLSHNGMILESVDHAVTCMQRMSTELSDNLTSVTTTFTESLETIVANSNNTIDKVVDSFNCTEEDEDDEEEDDDS